MDNLFINYFPHSPKIGVKDQPQIGLSFLWLQSSPAGELSIDNECLGAVPMFVPYFFLALDPFDANLFIEAVIG